MRMTMSMSPGSAPMNTIVLAFSGGLDTSFCAVWLREQTGAEIVTVCVDTGGFSAAGLAAVAEPAGNDQVRFDVAIAALAPGLRILTPIRDLNWSRQQEADWLAQHGVHVPAQNVSYSLNEGLFGTTIGGRETHDAWRVPPDSAYTM